MGIPSYSGSTCVSGKAVNSANTYVGSYPFLLCQDCTLVRELGGNWEALKQYIEEEQPRTFAEILTASVHQ